MTTTIGPNTRIDGRLEGDDDLVIEGRIDGTIALDAKVTIAASGYVTGDVRAPVIVVHGALSGTVRGSELVQLADGAQVEAEIFAEALRMDPGANLKGRIEMDVDAAPPVPKRTERQPATTSSSSASTTASSSASTTASSSSSSSNGATSSRSTPSSSSTTTAERAATSDSGRSSAPASSSTTVTVVDGDPDELTVKELREMLKEHDLPVSGTKSELIDRLRTIE